MVFSTIFSNRKRGKWNYLSRNIKLTFIFSNHLTRRDMFVQFPNYMNTQTPFCLSFGKTQLSSFSSTGNIYIYNAHLASKYTSYLSTLEKQFFY